MTDNHLNDAELQKYVLKKSNCEVYIIEHVTQCRNCKTKAEQYNLLLEGIKYQEKPTFDFNLADLVIGQLPKAEPKASYEKLFSYFIIFITIFFCCIAFYLFRSNLLNLFQGITPVSIALIMTTGISLLAFLGIDTYMENQTKIKTINLY
jgi:hypothetical protein